MKKETKILLLLLFLPPVLGELLTGSSPPLLFFNPVSLFMLVLLYGCGVLLIREAKVRWGLQWSITFLAISYGILEEGLMIQSFFNPWHADLGVLSRYGMYFGVQWPWAIELIFFHATVSTLIPIAIVELVWPEYKYTPLLKKRGLVLAFAGISFVTMFWMIFMVARKEDTAYKNYHPNVLLLFVAFVVITLLIFLAYRYRHSRILTRRRRIFPPYIFGITGFLFMECNVLLPSILAEKQIPPLITLLVQFVEILFALMFARYQIYNGDITKRHVTTLIFGSLLFFILLAPIQEFSKRINPDPTQGMFATGVVSLILLIIWKHWVLKTK